MSSTPVDTAASDAAADSKIDDGSADVVPQVAAEAEEVHEKTLKFLALREQLLTAINNDRKQAGCVNSHECMLNCFKFHALSAV